MYNLAEIPYKNPTETSKSALLQHHNNSLSDSVRHSLRDYFSQLEGEKPANLYDLVLIQIEKPLLEMVLQLTNTNQSEAAIILGISRGTLRKKMAVHGFLPTNHKR